MYINVKRYYRTSSKYDTMVFNHLSKRMRDKDTNFIYTGDTLAIVCEGNHYNFRLDQRTKESDDSNIEGKI